MAGSDDGDARGRRILLEVVVEAGVSCSSARALRGNPRSLVGSGVGGALVSLCLLGPRFGRPPDRGTCGVFGWFGRGEFVFVLAGRGPGTCVVVWSGGSGLSPPPVALRCGVDLVDRRPVWSVASELARGVVLYRFLTNFSYKRTSSFLLYQ